MKRVKFRIITDRDTTGRNGVVLQRKGWFGWLDISPVLWSVEAAETLAKALAKPTGRTVKEFEL